MNMEDYEFMHETAKEIVAELRAINRGIGGLLEHRPFSELDEKETFKPTHPVIRPYHSMTLTEYQGFAQRTANPADPIRLATAGLGVAGEAGELAGAIKKHLSHGHELDKEHIREEIGDVLWYLAEIAAALDMTLEEVALANIAKLKRRYPDGFDPERSKNRGEG